MAGIFNQRRTGSEGSGRAASIWTAPEAPVAAGTAGDPHEAERSAVALALSSRGLGERLFEAHTQRSFGPARAGWEARCEMGEPAAALDGKPADEMLRFVLDLDDRSLVRKGVFAGVAGGGPLPRRVQVAPALPRRARSAPVSGGPTTDVDACPSCGGTRLGVDEIDLDAGTTVRTCASCDHTFTSTI